MNKGDKPWKPAIVTNKYDKRRSCIVQSGDRLYTRDRRHLRVSNAADLTEGDSANFDETLACILAITAT